MNASEASVPVAMQRPAAIVWLTFIAISCGGPREPAPTLTQNAGDRGRDAVPRDLTIATATVWRQRTGSGPAWSRVEITNLFGFHHPPVVGDPVTVLTLDAGPPFELPVASTKKRDEIPEVEVWWEVELEPTTAAWLMSAPAQAGRAGEYPFDAVVLYPSVTSAHLVAAHAVRDLPPDTQLQEVTAAIDLDGDASADAITATYCCKDRSQAPGPACDYVCSATFRRLDGAWVVIHQSEPL